MPPPPSRLQDGTTALMIAAGSQIGSWMMTEERQIELCTLLLERGADVNTQTRLSWGDTSNGQTALLRAARSGNIRVIKLLLEHDADPHLASVAQISVVFDMPPKIAFERGSRPIDAACEDREYLDPNEYERDKAEITRLLHAAMRKRSDGKKHVMLALVATAAALAVIKVARPRLRR